MKFYYLKRSVWNYSQYKNAMLIIKDTWDDWFRFETNNVLKYVDSKGGIHDIGYVKIAQLGMRDDQRSANIPEEFDRLSEDFFSLGQSDYYYSNISSLGDDLRNEILVALRDVAYDLTIFNRVKSLSVMTNSLMREVSYFTIKEQFSRIAKGSARLTRYEIEYTYPNKDKDNVVLSFNVEPESFPPTNIHVVIGRNNVGKTYFIKNFISAAYLPDKKEEVGILRSSNSSTGRLRNARSQAFANILCVSFSPFDNYSELISAVEQSSISANEMPFKYIGLTTDNLHDELIRKFIEGINNCKKSQRKLDLLGHALDILETDPIFEKSNIKDLLVRSTEKQDESNSSITKDIFVKLSSGHQVIVLTLVQIVDNITERSLVVLDEPENHLHPPLLAAFIRALSELLIDRNGVAIIATHSPVVLQEVPKSCVWKINRNGREVCVSRLEIESFGATIGALTREVFGLEVRKSGFHKMLLEEVEKGLTYEEIIQNFNNELGDEAVALLRTLIMLREDKK